MALQNRRAPRLRGDDDEIKDHPAIQEFWWKLTYEPVGGSVHKIDPLESVLQKAVLITDDAGNERYFQLTRVQDGATAILLCRDLSLLHGLERTLQACAGKTIREISERDVRDDLTLN